MQALTTRRSFIASSVAFAAAAGCVSTDEMFGAANAPRFEFGPDGTFTFFQLTDLHLNPNGRKLHPRIEPCSDPKADENDVNGYKMDCLDGERRMLLAKGVEGVLKEHTCPPYWKTYRNEAHTFEGRTLYDSWKKMGNLKGAYFGHDHKNTFDGTDANGIRLGMTKCCTFWSYNDGNPGLRVFKVRADGTYSTEIFAESMI